MTEREEHRRLSSEQDKAAIIGMACVFPKAPNLPAFWNNIVKKVDAIGDPPKDRRMDEFFDPDPDEATKTYCARGGYLEDIPPFRPFDFGIMPVSIDGAEPEHFLALQVAHDALLDAGLREKPFNRERVEVILGRGTYVSRGLVTVLHHGFSIHQILHVLKELHPEYTPEQLKTLRDRLKSSIPPFTPETAPGLVPSVMAGLVANRLDLRGANYVVDAACASALVAAQNGVQDLISGKCDVVLTGAVQTSAAALMNILFTQFGALTRRSEIRPFAADADGTVIGEGVGMMVLKRLSDAVKDGHRIYAVIRGIGSSSDGKAKGILAPRLEGEMLALERAYEAAGVSPDTVGLIEAHGTAIPLGDETEISALRKFYDSGNSASPRRALGSVKSMIGHLLPAAGIAGMIKTALSLYHKTLPPTLHCDPPHPGLAVDNTSLYLNKDNRPWVHGDPENPRRAGVNAFGFGGINAHAVLEEAPDALETGQASLFGQWDTELCVLQAESREALIQEVRRVYDYLESYPETSLLDTAATLSTAMTRRPCSLGLVADSTADLSKKLAHALNRLSEPECRRIKDKSGIYYFENPLAREGRLAFLFPGEGSQYPHMLSDLCLHFPEIRRCFDELDRAFSGDSRRVLPSRRIFPEGQPVHHPRGEEGIWDMDYAVDAVLTADKALFEFFGRLAVRPDVIVGHSSGEIMALEAAGVIRLSGEVERRRYTLEGNRMIRGFLEEKAIPKAHLIAAGGMAREAALDVAESFGGRVHIAMHNCPHQIVLCALPQDLDELTARLRSAGIMCQVLPFSRPYHTPLFEPGRDSLEKFFSIIELQPPDIQMYSCVTAQPMPRDPDEIRRLAAEQWARPVRFQDTIEAMYEAGVRIFLETGPRSNLTGFVQDILKKKPHLAVAANVHHRSGLTQLNHCLGLLAAHGVHLDLTPLYARRMTRKLDFKGIKAPHSPLEPVRGTVPLSIGLPLVSLEADEPLLNELNPPRPISVRASKDSDRRPISEEKPRDGGALCSAIGTGIAEAPLTPGEPAGLSRPVDGTHGGVMQDHFATMERFLETQEAVMQAYFSASGDRPLQRPRAGEEKHAGETHPNRVHGVQDAGRADTSPDGPEVTLPGEEAREAGEETRPGEVFEETVAEVPSRAPIEDLLFSLISERTGYPPEVLSMDQNLEVDLGIDSIKRVEIFGAMARRLELTDDKSLEALSVLKTLGEIVRFLEGQGDDADPLDRVSPESTEQAAPFPSSSGMSALPFQGRIVKVTPGREIWTRRDLDLESDRFLNDHTLGGRVSRENPDLLGLPVLPFTMALEIMAEAASRLYPHQATAVSMRGLKTNSWITLENRTLPLAVHAEALPGGEARVELLVGNPVDKKSQAAVEGLFVFGEERPQAPVPGPFAIEGGLPCAFEFHDIYPSILYHGSSLGCISSMTRCGRNGSESVLVLPSEDGLFTHVRRPRLLLDPVLLDGAGQAVAVWAAHTLKTGFVVFPVGMEKVRFFKAPPGKGRRVICKTLSVFEGEKSILSDVQLIHPDGTLRAHIEGLRHKRIRMPEKFHTFRTSRDGMLSSPLEIPGDLDPALESVTCRRFDPADMDFDSTDGRVMRTVLAHIVLGQRERMEWNRLKKTGKRGTEWLLGRVAAKEAVRALLKNGSGRDLWPADIEIIKDKSGRPMVDGKWLGRAQRAPFLSISHSRGKAVALAATGQRRAGAGIDMEHFGSKGAGFEKYAFAGEEREKISALRGVDPAEWSFRAWCAKEAVSKALGTGLLKSPEDLFLKSINSETEKVEFELKGELAGRFPELKGKTLSARTFRDENVIYAIGAYDATV